VRAIPGDGSHQAASFPGGETRERSDPARDGGTSTTRNPSHTYANAGTYTVRLTVSSSASSATATKSAYITIAQTPLPSSGLVAAYSFEESSGSTVNDASGKANHGTISGAIRTTSGRYGRALQFDGVNDWVTIKDASSLDLTTGMTLEAWVYPTALNGGSEATARRSPPR
jgi:PKD repeat protein